MATTNRQLVREYVTKIMPLLETPASGRLQYPYLKINYGGHYPGIYEWDHHFAAMRFAYAGRPEYFKFMIDNLLHYQADDGFTPYCVTAQSGPSHYSPRLNCLFLMQAALMYLSQTGDRQWAQERFGPLKRHLGYLEANYATGHNLFQPPVSWSSGIDNDVVTCFFQPDTMIPCDLNSWIYLEFQSAAQLARKLGLHQDVAAFQTKADKLRRAMNEVLWYDEVDSYAAYNLCTCRPQFHLGDPFLDPSIGYYAFQSCSNLFPLFARICEPQKARKMIERYVLNTEHFMSAFGIRSLSKSSEFYNNAIWGNPPRFTDPRRLTNSNWQGPVWTLLSYLMFHTLRHYGYPKEAEQLADRTIDLLAKSVQTIGCFTENYHGETGEPLYAPKYASWNIVAEMMHAEVEEVPWVMNPMFEGDH